jgi:hypothetical protein
VARKLLISLSRYLETGMVPTGDEVTLFRAALARSPPGSASVPIFLVVRHEQIAKKRSPQAEGAKPDILGQALSRVVVHQSWWAPAQEAARCS